MDYCSHISPPHSFFSARESVVFIPGTYCLRKQKKKEYKRKRQALLRSKMQCGLAACEAREGSRVRAHLKEKSIPILGEGVCGVQVLWEGTCRVCLPSGHFPKEATQEGEPNLRSWAGMLLPGTPSLADLSWNLGVRSRSFTSSQNNRGRGGSWLTLICLYPWGSGYRRSLQPIDSLGF